MATGGEEESSRYVDEDAAVGGKIPAMCDPCGRRKRTTPAAVVCSSCDLNLCRECRQAHQIYAACEQKFVALDYVPTEKVLVDMQGLDQCSEHDRPFRFICKDHNTLCCDDCQFDSHRTCKDIHRIQDVGTDADSSLIGYVEEMQGTIVSARDMIESCSEKCQANDERRNQIMREIDRKKEEMINRFDDAKRRIGEELDEVLTSDKTRLDDVTLEAESVKVKLQNLVSLSDEVSKHRTGVEKTIINFTCKQKAAWATTKLAQLQKNNYSVQHTLEWSDHVLAHVDEELVTLRQAPPPSVTDTEVGKAYNCFRFV